MLHGLLREPQRDPLRDHHRLVERLLPRRRRQEPDDRQQPERHDAHHGQHFDERESVPPPHLRTTERNTVRGATPT